MQCCYADLVAVMVADPFLFVAGERLAFLCTVHTWVTRFGRLRLSREYRSSHVSMVSK